MPTTEALRLTLARVLDWEDAHAGVDRALAAVPPARRGERPAGLPHSPWELLEHMRLTQRDILDFCRDPKYEEPSWPADYWPPTPAPPTEDAWERSAAELRADREALRAIASDRARDLFALVPRGHGQTYLRELLLVVDHTAYHTGQLVLVLRAMGAWPGA